MTNHNYQVVGFYYVRETNALLEAEKIISGDLYLPYALRQLLYAKGLLYKGITTTRQYLFCLAVYAVAT